MSRRGWVLFLAMCVIWGLPYLLIRVAVRDLSPASVVFARCAIGAVLLLPVAAWRGTLGALRPVAGWVIAFTIVEVAIPWLLLTRAEQHLTSSFAGLLVSGVPLIGIVANRMLGGDETVTVRRMTGLLVGLGGVAALVGLQVGHVDLVSVGLIGIVSVGYAVGPIILSRRLSGAPGIAVIAVALSLTALGYAPAALTSHPHQVTGHEIASIITLGVVCTAVAFLVFFALIAEIGPTRATVITYVNPAVAITLGVSLLGEHFTTGMAIGFPLIIAGSMLAAAGPPTAPPTLPSQALDDLDAGEIGQSLARQNELGASQA